MSTKRISAGFLSAIFLLALLIGCGGSQNEESAVPDKPASSDQSVPDSAPEASIASSDSAFNYETYYDNINGVQFMTVSGFDEAIDGNSVVLSLRKSGFTLFYSVMTTVDIPYSVDTEVYRAEDFLLNGLTFSDNGDNVLVASQVDSEYDCFVTSVTSEDVSEGSIIAGIILHNGQVLVTMQGIYSIELNGDVIEAAQYFLDSVSVYVPENTYIEAPSDNSSTEASTAPSSDNQTQSNAGIIFNDKNEGTSAALSEEAKEMLSILFPEATAINVSEYDNEFVMNLDDESRVTLSGYSMAVVAGGLRLHFLADDMGVYRLGDNGRWSKIN